MLTLSASKSSLARGSSKLNLPELTASYRVGTSVLTASQGRLCWH
jgi:hypothetical protein